jgi:5-methylcytosine-specific restriction endonuclease McrA
VTYVSEVLRQSVVVFSQNYLPITRINIKRAIALLIAGKAEPAYLSTKGWEVHAPNLILFVPEHIRLKIARTERSWKVPRVSRREVLKRDRHACQYCGSKKHLTLDHVVPRSRGGKHTWDNVVAACASCNSRKGSRTPTEAQMPLLSQPKPPLHPTVAFAEEFWQQHNRVKLK